MPSSHALPVPQLESLTHSTQRFCKQYLNAAFTVSQSPVFEQGTDLGDGAQAAAIMNAAMDARNRTGQGFIVMPRLNRVGGMSQS